MGRNLGYFRESGAGGAVPETGKREMRRKGPRILPLPVPGSHASIEGGMDAAERDDALVNSQPQDSR